MDFGASLNVQIRMTAVNALWQNGTVERHHATADVIVQKLIKLGPKISIQDTIYKAAFAKNSEINHTRFSAMQLMMGHFPGLAEANPVSSNHDSSSKYMKSYDIEDHVYFYDDKKNAWKKGI